jgi:hypothetical protein
MSDNEQTADRAKATSEIAWGAKAIGAIINRTERQVNHLLVNGHIKSARKVGGLYVANVDALRREFGGQP